MTMLDSTQRKTLKVLMKHPLSSTEDFSDNDLYLYGYLREVGYVRIETSQRPVELQNGFYSVNTTVTAIQITEKGKAYLYQHRITTLCFIIPTTISIISLLISLLSLVIGYIEPLLTQLTK